MMRRNNHRRRFRNAYRDRVSNSYRVCQLNQMCCALFGYAKLPSHTVCRGIRRRNHCLASHTQKLTLAVPSCQFAEASDASKGCRRASADRFSGIPQRVFGRVPSGFQPKSLVWSIFSITYEPATLVKERGVCYPSTCGAA